jgi:outer membrane protein assembly factor BamB
MAPSPHRSAVRPPRRRLPPAILALALAALVGACGSAEKLIDKFTGTDSEKFAGPRESVLANTDANQVTAATEPVVIPAAISNQSWAQPGGVPSNAMHNLALNMELRRVFAVSAGRGSDSDGRLTASPIVVGGRVYVLDSEAVVRAFAADQGGLLWSTSLVPEGADGEGAFGGGLASDGARIYATTAFGEALALDAASGAILWRQKFDSPIRSAPTVADGRMYFVTISNEVNAVSTADGTSLWRYQGTGESAAVLASSSPAVAGGVAVLPHTSGELSAFNAGDGRLLWTEALSSSDPVKGAANLNDIAARPVISDGQVYALAQSGRFAAFHATSGAQVWSQDISGNQTPWVAGEYVFVLSGRRNLVAVQRTSGGVRWITDLPGAGVWSGPVIGGGRLIAVSSEGALANISPQTGQVMSTMDVGSSFYIAPVIANGTIYLLADDGELIALR